jgi:hypothetical protein
MKITEKERQMDRQVAESIEQEWLRAGVSREELEQERQLADLLRSLLAAGRRADDLLDEWEGKSAEEILREYGREPAREAETMEVAIGL